MSTTDPVLNSAQVAVILHAQENYLLNLLDAGELVHPFRASQVLALRDKLKARQRVAFEEYLALSAEQSEDT